MGSRRPHKFLFERSSRDLVQVLRWRSCRCHVLEVLVWKLLRASVGRFWPQGLAKSVPAAAGPVWRSCELLCGVPAWRSWSGSFTSPCVKILWRSCWTRGPGPLGVLRWSRTGPCKKIFWRCFWNPPQEFLALRFWKCTALVLVWKFFWDAHRKFLYEDLVIDLHRSSSCCSCDLF